MRSSRFAPGDFTALVDNENGWIDRSLFIDPDIYEEELHRIFGRAWNFVAHESQLKKPGDFLTMYVGEDAVIVSRAADKSIRVFTNSCPHRGNKVCFADAGNSRRFVCNYHGWSFDNTGQLIGMHADYGYDPGDIDMKNTRMVPARVETYKGLVFATFDQDVCSLSEWLGDFRWYLDMILDQDEGGVEFVGGCIKNEFPANWKTGVENFIGDAAHAGWTHDSGSRVMSGGPFPDPDNENSYHASVNGHGWEFGLDGVADIAVLGSPLVMDYYRSIRPAMRERLGEARAKIFGSIASASVFPNISFLPGISTFRVWLPKGPEKFELRSWIYVNKSMPEEVKDEITRKVMMTFSPGGLFEMDDGENWANCTTGNRGVVTRSQKLHYREGISRLIPNHPEYPGTIYRGQLNDANQRAFYARWAELMECDNMAKLPPRPEPRMSGRETRDLADLSVV